LIGSIVARRYAKALYALGRKKGVDELEAYAKDLDALAAALAASPELVRVFRNPIFSVEEKKGVVAKLLDAISPTGTVRNFCFLLADKERLPVLGEIVAFFNALLDVDRGVLRGELVTAVELAEAKQQAVLQQLEGQAKQKLVLDFSVDENILGGVVLKIGDRTLDASLRAQLGILKENIKRGE
jgi:F-type H+-transporting ATPase subunit delta